MAKIARLVREAVSADRGEGHPGSQPNDRMLDKLAQEVARDFSGRIVVGADLAEIDV